MPFSERNGIKIESQKVKVFRMILEEIVSSTVQDVKIRNYSSDLIAYRETIKKIQNDTILTGVDYTNELQEINFELTKVTCDTNILCNVCPATILSLILNITYDSENKNKDNWLNNDLVKTKEHGIKFLRSVNDIGDFHRESMIDALQKVIMHDDNNVISNTKKLTISEIATQLIILINHSIDKLGDMGGDLQDYYAMTTFRNCLAQIILISKIPIQQYRFKGNNYNN